MPIHLRRKGKWLRRTFTHLPKLRAVAPPPSMSGDIYAICSQTKGQIAEEGIGEQQMLDNNTVTLIADAPYSEAIKDYPLTMVWETVLSSLGVLDGVKLWETVYSRADEGNLSDASSQCQASGLLLHEGNLSDDSRPCFSLEWIAPQTSTCRARTSEKFSVSSGPTSGPCKEDVPSAAFSDPFRKFMVVPTLGLGPHMKSMRLLVFLHYTHLIA